MQSLTQHELAAKKATSTTSNAGRAVNNVGALPPAPDGPTTAAGRRLTAATAAVPLPPTDQKLVEMLAKYRQQVEASESAGGVLKLPTISPRPTAVAEAARRAAADQQWLLPLPEVKSSSSGSSVTSQKRGAKNGNESGDDVNVAAAASTSAVGPTKRSLTAFPGSINTRSRDLRK